MSTALIVAYLICLTVGVFSGLIRDDYYQPATLDDALDEVYIVDEDPDAELQAMIDSYPGRG